MRNVASSAEQVPERLERARRIDRISVIVPMLNEAAHVEQFVADVAAQDFGGDVETIVADGASTDGSVALLENAAKEAGLDLTVLPNPARWVSPGLNACIGLATGDLIVRLDCHSRYPADYLRLCAEVAEESEALVVGGLIVPEGRTPTERAVAAAMDSPFGGVGWTRGTRGTSEQVRRDSDVLPYGAFLPEAFALAGLFDESLVRNQDDEFTLRIRRAGGRVLLDSRIRISYTPRGSLREVFRQYFQYGFWKVRVMRKHRQVVSARSLVPPAFVASLGVLAPAAAFFTAARVLLVFELAGYACGALVFGVRSLRARREPLRLLPRVLAVYPTFHLSYGLGVVWGLLRSGSSRPRPALSRS
jgi:succinoglycan biosynthesis protein ExoA